MDRDVKLDTPQLFEAVTLYTIKEIEQRLKCKRDWLQRHLKSAGIKRYRFGSITYMGSDLNKFVESQSKVG